MRDWLGNKTPRIGDSVDFVCEGDSIKSVVPLLDTLLLNERQSQHSQILLAFASFFVGALGIHRFMVGKVGTGLVMLLLTLTIFLTPITAIWAFIDFIMILTGSFTDKDGHRVKNS
ncbi:TM2 domain-containing protein [Bartonella raoultii]|uniref:TM2 domain-containing protein n=1 Tax=Bartonella raoultii TaxID=1457020 RepID=A0ABS7I6Y7_9HYPH|nr:TM2 domain-containing protein [Bartonella raoultii]MBX4336212.1 TM2 domain-containing protein [Bartonella raoultii]